MMHSPHILFKTGQIVATYYFSGDNSDLPELDAKRLKLIEELSSSFDCDITNVKDFEQLFDLASDVSDARSTPSIWILTGIFVTKFVLVTQSYKGNKSVEGIMEKLASFEFPDTTEAHKLTQELINASELPYDGKMKLLEKWEAFAKSASKHVRKNSNFVTNNIGSNLGSVLVSVGDGNTISQSSDVGFVEHNSLLDLQNDLKILRNHLVSLRVNDDPTIDVDIGTIAEAEISAKDGKLKETQNALSKVSTRVLPIAEKIGVPVVVSAIKSALGL